MNRAHLLYIILFISSIAQVSAQKEYNLGNTTIEVSSLKQNIVAPWEIIWGPDNYIWMTHENGSISRVNPVNGESQVVLQIPDMYADNNLTANRMVGITIGSDFDLNPYVYINYVYKGEAYTSKNWTRYEKIVRYTFDANNSTLSEPFILLDGIKVYDGWRIGGKLLIHPDNAHLFLTIGDAKQPDYPENHPDWTSGTPKPLSLESFSGKIIRIKTDGSIPTDNPFYEDNDKSKPRNLIWSYGHRNTQGLVFGENNKLYYAEHGANGNDEFGEVIIGGNYGWPTVQGACDTPDEISFCNANPDFVPPLKEWVSTIAPSNMEFYKHSAIPEWQNAALLGTLTAFSGDDRAGEDIRVLTLDQAGQTVMQESILFDNEYLRIRDLCVSPSGEVFFTTSNTIMNGGLKNVDDDHIYKIRALNTSTENFPPTDILLSSNAIIENMEAGTLIGTFSSIDTDNEDTHKYTLVNGTGDADNNAFSISGNQLLSNVVFERTVQERYSIRVKSEDQAGGSIEKIFTINILEEAGNYFKIEMEESNFEVVNDVGGNGVVEVFSESITDQGSGQAVILPDDGDKMLVRFNISQAGRYKIRIGTRSGDARGKTSFWFDEQSVPLSNYIFTLNGADFAIAGDKSCPDIYFTSNWGNSYWGPMINTIQFLGAGEHELTIEANSSWLGVDYLELEYVPATANQLEFEDDFTILNDAGTVGEPRVLYEETIYDCDGGLAIMVWDAGDEIAKDFEVSTAGNYSIHVRARVGDANEDLNLLNRYEFTLDGNPIVLSLDESSLLNQETWGKSTWGIFKTQVEDLSAGNHQLSVRANGNYLGLDYLEINALSDDINYPPSDILLSNNAIEENLPTGTLIGELSTIDSNPQDVHTYTFSAIDSADNAQFAINGNELSTNASFDFETKNSYSISIRATDSAGAFIDKNFAISILDVFENTPPTDILLDNNQIVEDAPLGTVIGNFTSVDADEDYHFYEFVEGVGGNDNNAFDLVDNTLVSNLLFDFETQNTYSIRISSNDRNGGILEKVFTINIITADRNNPPSAIVLNNNSIQELQPLKTLVGTLSSIDADEGDEHTYALVNGEGDVDNSAFTIENTQLLSNAIFDFEAKNSYSIRIKSTDLAGDSVEQVFAINILDSLENQVPTDILLSNSSIAENNAIGTSIGIFETNDPDANDTHTYQLIDGDGSDDNNLFIIEDNLLKSAVIFDFENRSSYSIRVEATDQAEAKIEKVFSIEIEDIFENEPPTDITLSANQIAEKKPIGTVIGVFNTADANVEDEHTYTLVNGENDAGNATFKINQNQLLSNTVFDFEVQTSYSIRIRSTDLAGAFIEKSFEINVLDSAENTPPSDILLSDSSIEEKEPLNTEIGIFNSVDADEEDTHRFSLVPGIGGSDNLDFAIAENRLLSRKSFDYAEKSEYSIRVRTYDSNDGIFEKIFSIEILPKNLSPVLNEAIPDQVFSTDELINFSLNANTFSDPEGGVLSYSALLDKSNPLPNWLNFEASTLTFAGNPTIEHEGDYQIYVIAKDEKGNEAEDDFTLTIKAPLSNETKSFDNTLSIFPNPVNNLLYLELQNSELGHLQIEIFALDGKQVMSRIVEKFKRKASITFDVSSLKSGVYTVVLTTSKGIKQTRIVKMNGD